MEERNAHLIAFIEAITTHQAHRFEHVVKMAYIDGVNREELLTAVKIARLLVDLPDPIVTQASATLHAWHWLVARRLEHQRSLAPEPPARPSGSPPLATGPPAGLGSSQISSPSPRTHRTPTP